MQNHQRNLIELSTPGLDAPRPARADALENRARLLRVAAMLFAAQGVEAVNMTAIARTAEVGQGTLYRHFSSKGDLCMALMDAQMCDFQEQVLAQLRARGAAGEPYLAQLAWFIDHYIHFQMGHAPLLTCAGHEHVPKFHPEPGPFVWLRMTVQGLLRAASAAAELSADADSEFAAAALLILLRPDLVNTMRETHQQSTDRIIAGLQQIVHALLAK